MSKGQKRSNREPKKPKRPKQKIAPPSSSTAQLKPDAAGRVKKRW
jgi:hypothetical protein